MVDAVAEIDRRAGALYAGRVSSGFVWAALILFLLAGFTILHILVSSRVGAGWLFNSDLLQPFLVMKDAMRDPSSLLSWYHSPAIYVFPDFVAAAILQLLPIPNDYRPLLYGGLLLTAYSLIFGWILSVAGVARALPGALAAAAAIGLLWVPVYAFPATYGAGMTTMIAAPFIHTGALLFGLMAIALISGFCLDPASAKWSSWQFRLALLVGYLAGYSDLLFAAWFLVPALLCWITLDSLCGRRPRYGTAATLFLAAFLGFATEEVLRLNGTGGPVYDFDSIQYWLRDVSDAFARGDWFFATPVVLTGFMVARGVWIGRQVRRTRAISPGNAVEAILIACNTFGILTPAIAGSYEGLPHLRYGLPMFLLPYLWLLVVAMRALPRLPLRVAPIAVVLLWAGIAATRAESIFATAEKLGPSIDPSACLLEHGLKEGFGDYWTAKLVMFRSEGRVHIVQISEQVVGRFRWNFNERWFSHHIETGQLLQPTFVVISRLHPSAVEAYWGPPARTLTCGADLVWLYDAPLALPG